MKHSSIKSTLIGAAICVVSAAQVQTASAQTAAPPPLRAACGPDMQVLCPGLKGKDARQCLGAHHAQISAGCMAFLDGAKARRGAGAMAPPPAGGAPPSAPPGGTNE